MFRRSATILVIALLALGGAACGNDSGGDDSGRQDSRGGATASDATAPPPMDFCDLLVKGAPMTSEISENIQHYEALRSEAPDSLEPDIDAVIEWYESQAAEGRETVTVGADPETQRHIAKIVDAAFECTN